MNLQNRKLTIIEYLIHLQDDAVFSKIEAILADSKTPVKELKKEELITRAMKANEDIVSNRVLSQDELEVLSKGW